MGSKKYFSLAAITRGPVDYLESNADFERTETQAQTGQHDFNIHRIRASLLELRNNAFAMKTTANTPRSRF